jgi:hypothetical protein|uniref:Uncharacterized protein n=1 Tax=Picea sitchensis TaxID=3332 RepID=A0A6B9XPU9_PICSI|nr:hypothetical protein Q903MT_gene4033 [Picea sitchensis]
MTEEIIYVKIRLSSLIGFSRDLLSVVILGGWPGLSSFPPDKHLLRYGMDAREIK